MNYDYPELYYRIYPKVIEVVNDNEKNNINVNDITDEQLNKMADTVYIRLVEEYPEIHEDPIERRYRRGRYSSMQRPYYGRMRITRDLITILLISELLRRRNLEIYYW